MITARAGGGAGQGSVCVRFIHSPLAKAVTRSSNRAAKLAESATTPRRTPHSAPARPRASAPFLPRPMWFGAAASALGYEACDMDTLAARSGLNAAAISALLTHLELSGVVAALPAASSSGCDEKIRPARVSMSPHTC